MRTLRRQCPNLNKNGKVGKVLHSYPEHCIVCSRSSSVVDFHPYTSQKNRQFCHRDRYVTEAIRKFGFNLNTGHKATTCLAYDHRSLIKLLEGKLSYEDIAKAVIWAEYHKNV